jgi:hypothetical protein
MNSKRKDHPAVVGASREFVLLNQAQPLANPDSSLEN